MYMWSMGKNEKIHTITLAVVISVLWIKSKIIFSHTFIWSKHYFYMKHDCCNYETTPKIKRKLFCHAFRDDKKIDR